ncbi:AGROH133_08824 family phage infection protein [Nitratireductor sp. CH_MIT9313-5]|jgi:ABC-type multidrug transport system permease subunit|uniref:AGROH133_08824 family phage infection protein n=1 Tax=Nitratireductor sp. CH_MIT9313-5 TaxID=3107764 RepID=UPI00300A444D
MEFALPWPTSDGEWLAWSSAAATIFFGFIAMFAPGTTLRLLRLDNPPMRNSGLSTVRAQLGGFYIGIGVAAILFAQPLIYLALGLAWAIALFGRIVSMMSDRANTLHNWIALVLNALLAALPLAFTLGFIS